MTSINGSAWEYRIKESTHLEKMCVLLICQSTIWTKSILLYIEDAKSKMAVNSNAILLLKFKMSARKRQTNISPSLGMDLLCRSESCHWSQGRLSTDFLQSHPSPCICVKQFSIICWWKNWGWVELILKKVRFCSQLHLYSLAKAVNVTWSVTCLTKDRICHSACRINRDYRAL